MAVRVEPQATRHSIDGALEVGVVKRHQTPAGVAQKVMMVCTGGVDQLIAGRGVPQLQAPYQAPLLQKLQDAIDARARHATLAGAQTVFDLQRAEGARLACEQVDHRVARSALLVSSLVEHGTSVL